MLCARPVSTDLTSENGGIARLAAAASSGQRPADIFVIGPGNTYHQAWEAMLAGHQIRMPDWPSDLSWIFSRNIGEILKVQGDYLEDWIRTGAVTTPTGNHQLSLNWHVLPKIDRERPIV